MTSQEASQLREAIALLGKLLEQGETSGRSYPPTADDRPAPAATRPPATSGYVNTTRGGFQGPPKMGTEKQAGFAGKLFGELDWTRDEADKFLRDRLGVADITKAPGGKVGLVIDELIELRDRKLK